MSQNPKKSSGNDKTFLYVVGFFAALFLLGIIGSLVLGKKSVDQPTTLAQSSTTGSLGHYYHFHIHQRRPPCRSTHLRSVSHPLAARLRDRGILSGAASVPTRLPATTLTNWARTTSRK